MSRRLLLAALAVLAAALAGPGVAQAGRIAVGLEPGADVDAVVRAVERHSGAEVEHLTPIPALVLDAPRGLDTRVLLRVRGVRYVERLHTRSLSVLPTDPLVPRQWYLTQSRFYESWLTLPALESVAVAVIDSGVDASHPDLAGKILDARSFVGGSPRVDTLGHGTFVSGLVAAGVDNGIGIAGLAPSAELLVAKVVTRSRAIPIEAEVRAIRWAVDRGAQVINMSLGGVRDPMNADRDSYSRLEADAIAYAVSNGVVVVAAVGNGDQAPRRPWPYASYPAALPHVLGVSAVTESGAVPSFSNRDEIYNDIAAPGENIISLLPRPLTSRYPSCSEQGYSSCGPDEYRGAQGTSFAAPVVTAAAATLLALRPDLAPDQVTAILQRTAVDQTPATGCTSCTTGRDALTGWGRLDVAAATAALSRPLPTRDRYETNDDTGDRAFRLTGQSSRLFATLDYWDDQDDVYAIRLRRGQRVYVGLTGRNANMDLSLALWRPGTPSIEPVHNVGYRAKISVQPGGRQYFSHRAGRDGWYYVQIRASAPGATRYRLVVVKS